MMCHVSLEVSGPHRKQCGIQKYCEICRVRRLLLCGVVGRWCQASQQNLVSRREVENPHFSITLESSSLVLKKQFSLADTVSVCTLEK